MEKQMDKNNLEVTEKDLRHYSNHSIKQLIKRGEIDNVWMLRMYEEFPNSNDLKRELEKCIAESSIRGLMDEHNLSSNIFKKALEELDINTLIRPSNEITKLLAKKKTYQERRNKFFEFLDSCKDLNDVKEKSGLKSDNAIYNLGVIFKIDIILWAKEKADKMNLTGIAYYIKRAINKNYVTTHFSPFNIPINKMVECLKMDFEGITRDKLIEYLKLEYPNNIFFNKEQREYFVKGFNEVSKTFKSFMHKCMHYDSESHTAIDDIIDEFLKYSNVFVSKISVKRYLKSLYSEEFIPYAWNKDAFDKDSQSNTKNIVCRYLRLRDRDLDKKNDNKTNIKINSNKKELENKSEDKKEKSYLSELINLLNDDNVKKFISLLGNEEIVNELKFMKGGIK